MARMLMAMVVLSCFQIRVLAQEPTSSPALLRYTELGKTGYIDRSGKVVIKAEFEKASDFSEGLAAVWIFGPDLAFPIAGFIDTSGHWKIKAQFDKVGDFHEGYARVRLLDDQGTWALASTSGQIVKVPAAETTGSSMSVGDVSEGLAAFSPLGDEYGYMSPSGTLVIAPSYHFARAFHEGFAVVCKDWSNCGYIDSKGKEITRFQFVEAQNFRNGRGRACDKKMCGYVDKQGAFSESQDVFWVKETYGQHIVDYNPEGLHAYWQGAKFGYLDDHGRSVIKPQFKSAQEFSEGLAAVTLDNGDCGFIDRTGKFVVPAIFTICDDYSGGLAGVGRSSETLGMSLGYIDKKAHVIWWSTATGLEMIPPLQKRVH